jgi:hypothetical protein
VLPLSVSHGKYIKYVSFPWPPVVTAHDHKRLARALHFSGSYWRYKNYPYTQYSVNSIRSYPSLQTVQKTISYQNLFAMTTFKDQGRTLKSVRIYPPSPGLSIASSMWNFPDLLHLTHSLLGVLKGTDNVEKNTDNVKYLKSRSALKFQIHK